jgi:hypothetical protein
VHRPQGIAAFLVAFTDAVVAPAADIDTTIVVRFVLCIARIVAVVRVRLLMASAVVELGLTSWLVKFSHFAGHFTY